MTQVATLVADTDCLALVMMLLLSFFSSPHTVLRLPHTLRGARSSPGAPRRIWRVAGQSAGAMQLTLKTMAHTLSSRCMMCQVSSGGDSAHRLAPTTGVSVRR